MACKQKSPEELSVNPHTIKAHNHQVGMTDTKLKIDKAKKADIAVIIYVVRKLKESAEWQSADLSTQS